MPIDETRFRHTLSQFVSGVTIVTTKSQERLYGITVSSFSSLSLNPPLVLICIGTSSSLHDVLIEVGSFVVNILEVNQEHLSSRFAMRDQQKFTGVAWHNGQLGLPILDSALASIECRLHARIPGGAHTIFVGEVVYTEVNDGQPLVYCRRSYYALQERDIVLSF